MDSSKAGRRLSFPLARSAAAGLAGLALVLAASGCGRHGKAAPVGGSDLTPSQVKLKRSVELARAEQRPIQIVVETVGYLEAEGQTEIAAGVTGLVDEVLFREGQVVDRNTILVKVDQKRYLAAAEVTRANERRAAAAGDLPKDAPRRAHPAGPGGPGPGRGQGAPPHPP